MEIMELRSNSIFIRANNKTKNKSYKNNSHLNGSSRGSFYNKIFIGAITIDKDLNTANKGDQIKDIIFNGVKDIGKKTKTLIQLFNPDAILSTKHIYYAVYYGLTSFLKGINISNDRNLEIILYASQQRQINVALKIMGLNYEGLGVNTHDNFNNLIYFAVEGNSEDAINHALRDLTQLLINTSSDKAFDQNISTISPPNRKKIYDIKKLFNVSDNEIRISLMTLGFPEKLLINEINDKNLEDALLGCIIERMALLSLENASKL